MTMRSPRHLLRAVVFVATAALASGCVTAVTDTGAGDGATGPTSTIRGAEEAPIEELPQAAARLLVTGEVTADGRVDFTVINDSADQFTLDAVIHGNGTIDGPTRRDIKPGGSVHYIVAPAPDAAVIEIEVVPAEDPNLGSSASVAL